MFTEVQWSVFMDGSVSGGASEGVRHRQGRGDPHPGGHPRRGELAVPRQGDHRDRGSR